jgi:hypothetical protein
MKVKIGERLIPVDESDAKVVHVDSFIEDGAREGIVYLGLGQFIRTEQPEDAFIKGAVHLRMSIGMASRIVETLMKHIQKAEQAEKPKAKKAH